MASEEIRVVFMGTPDFAVPTLSRLVEDGYNVALVVTQPDRRKGRHGKTVPPPVKEYAVKAEMPVFQPDSLRSESAVTTILRIEPDIIIVAAYGEILPLSLLNVPTFGCLNVHASLLPRYRGASPIVASILAGDKETGVTIMLMDQGLDTGDILSQTTEPIYDWDTQETLSTRLATLGADTLSRTLPLWIEGRIKRTSQNEALACHTPLVRKTDGRIQWRDEAGIIERMVRAFIPWPLAHTYWNGKQISIWSAAAVGSQKTEKPGRVIGVDDASVPSPDGPRTQRCMVVATGDGLLAIANLQLAGGRAMTAEEFLRGHPSVVGSVLNQEDS